MRYLSQPDAIAKKAKKIVEQYELNKVSRNHKQIAQAMVQATADPSIADHIRVSPHVTPQLFSEIADKKILCDVEMVRAGINQKLYTGRILCFINDIQVCNEALQKDQTRSMTAVDQWKAYLDDAVVMIGNAPTALFRFLECNQHWNLRPALVIGIPVGFVGAAQAKRLLWQTCLDENLPCITVLGPRGGCALTVSALHAVAHMANSPVSMA